MQQHSKKMLSVTLLSKFFTFNKVLTFNTNLCERHPLKHKLMRERHPLKQAGKWLKKFINPLTSDNHPNDPYPYPPPPPPPQKIKINKLKIKN